MWWHILHRNNEKGYKLVQVIFACFCDDKICIRGLTTVKVKYLDSGFKNIWLHVCYFDSRQIIAM